MAKFTNWLQALNHAQEQNRSSVLVTVVNTQGSSPRKSGSKMLVTAEHSFDTIGGGKLEFQAINEARKLLLEAQSQQRFMHFPLAAKSAQCCGGTMTLMFESFIVNRAQIHVYGAGHVAKHLVPILAQLDTQIAWVDNRDNEFPQQLPSNVEKYLYNDVTEHVNKVVTENSLNIIVTHNHAVDFQLVEALLDRKDTHYLGVIGSKSKAQRFRTRLKSNAFSEDAIKHMISPIGVLDIPGDKPAEIAISIAAQVQQFLHSLNLKHADQQESHELDKNLTTAKKVSGISWKSLKPLLSEN